MLNTPEIIEYMQDNLYFSLEPNGTLLLEHPIYHKPFLAEVFQHNIWKDLGNVGFCLVYSDYSDAPTRYIITGKIHDIATFCKDNNIKTSTSDIRERMLELQNLISLFEEV